MKKEIIKIEKENLSILRLMSILIEVGIFIPVVISLIFVFSGANEGIQNKTSLMYLFLPGMYLISYFLIDYKKLNSKIVNFLLQLNILFLGLSLIYLSRVPELVSSSETSLSKVLLSKFFSFILLDISFVAIPIFVLIISLFGFLSNRKDH